MGVGRSRSSPGGAGGGYGSGYNNQGEGKTNALIYVDVLLCVGWPATMLIYIDLCGVAGHRTKH